MFLQLKKKEEYCRNQLVPYLKGKDVKFVYEKKAAVDRNSYSCLPTPLSCSPVSLLGYLILFSM